MANQTKEIGSEEIIFRILKELPAKSLMRFKCVSKYWLRIIEDPYFVNCHRVRSHTRPGGIQFLSQIKEGTSLSYFSLDPEGNFQSKLKVAAYYSLYSDRISHAEALVSFGECIWNPSTGETIDPHPGTMEKYYLLGFNAFTNQYKIVCCWTTWRQNARNRVHALHVSTLGQYSWKPIPFIPEVIRGGFEILSSRSFSNMIFCLIKCGIEEKYGLVTFDVQNEHVGFIYLPCDVLSDGRDIQMHIGEIQGRLALQADIGRKFWVLNHEIAEWTKMEITVTAGRRSCFKTWYDYVFVAHDRLIAHLIPICTIRTNEILLRLFAVERRSSGQLMPLHYIYYNPKTKEIRLVPKLDKNIGVLEIKYVDSVVRLKPPKQQQHRL